MGFTDLALGELRNLSEDPTIAAGIRANSFLQIGRWHLMQGDLEAAHEHAVLSRLASGNLPPQREQPAFEIDTLVALGRYAEGADVLRQAIELEPGSPHLSLRAANVLPRPEADARLEAINEVLHRGGLAPIMRRDATRPLSIDNITCVDEPTPVSGPLVSVIVPAYNSERTIGTAIRSLAHQTWRNLEIIVVDDGSTDETCSMIEQDARRDPRIRLLSLSENQGAYAARNAGLQASRGDFITVHDADDWSHVEKIAVQMSVLQSDPQLLACTSDGVRAGSDLEFTWSILPSRRIVRQNISSLLFDRRVLDLIGYWDDVRANADSEFLARLTQACGNQTVADCNSGTPLAFGRRGRNSLTTSPTFKNTGSLHALGSRRIYTKAYQWWHSRDKFTDEIPYIPLDAARPYPVPFALYSQHPEGKYSQHVERAILLDMRNSQAVTDLYQQVSKGNSVGLIDTPDPHSDVNAPIDARIFEICSSQGVRLLSSADHVSAGSRHYLAGSAQQHLPDGIDDLLST